MNCPLHIIIAQRIYKKNCKLPIKLFEFSDCYRNEKSGSICGMFRLNKFVQDDAHSIHNIINIEKEIMSFINNVYEIYQLFNININNIHFRLSLVDKQDYIGTEQQRIKIHNVMRTVLVNNNINYYEEYDGAFYAPKIDVIIYDSQNRKWQTGTIQIDFCILSNLSFQIQNEHSIENICVIHRAILGTFERFIAIVIEHNNSIPEIINPYQVAVIFINKEKNIREKIYNEIIDKLNNQNSDLNINTIDFIECNNINEGIKKMRKIPYIYQIVIGDREVSEKLFILENTSSKEYKEYKLS